MNTCPHAISRRASAALFAAIALLISFPICAEEPADDALRAVCRELIKAPRSGKLRARLAEHYGELPNNELRGRVGVLNCLSQQLAGDKGGATLTQNYLKKNYPFHPDLKYLSPGYTAALCLECEGQGKLIATDGSQHRCVSCRELGWRPSAEQREAVFLTLLRRVGYDRPDLEPRRQHSIVETLNAVNAHAADYLLASDGPARDRARQSAVQQLAGCTSSNRLAMRAEVTAVGYDGQGIGRIGIGPFSVISHPETQTDKLALMLPRWIRVQATREALRSVSPGDEMTIVAVPRYFSGRIAGDDRYAEEQLLMALRPSGTVRLLGSITSRHYKCRIGECWFVDPFK